MIAAVWGDEKAWKSTFGLSFPKPLFHLDLDVGGFDRAIWRFPELRVKRLSFTEKLSTVDWSQYDIVDKPYPIPIQMERLLGAQKVGTTIRFPRQIVGYKKVWESIVVDFVEACQGQAATIFPDSATMLWSICHTALLEDKQQIQLSQGMKVEDDHFRERLQPVEFPNDRMRSLIYTARSFGKNLILSHYPRDVYADRITEKGKEEYRTGEITLDGFKDTQKLVDIVIYLSLEWLTNPVTHERKQDIVAKITRCGLPGLGTKATGEIIAPSYQGILDLIDTLKA